MNSNQPNIDSAGIVRPTGASAVSTRQKKITKFFITVTDIEVYDTVRSDFIELFSDVNSYCVVIEKHKLKESYHLHCFVSFNFGYLYEEFREYVELIVSGFHFDLQKVKSTKSVLKYITKEDRNPFFNVKVDDLHFNYRAYLWAVKTDRFMYSDPFVLEHRFCYRFLRKLFEEVNKQSQPDFFDYFPIYECFDNWTRDVCLWWNNFILKRGVVKQKQLYLWGTHEMGKSSFVETLLTQMDSRRIYYPDRGVFAFTDLDFKFHKVILFEEFNAEDYNIDVIKRLIEGRMVSLSVKNGIPNRGYWRKPVIFISNYDLQTEQLRSRLNVVQASLPFWISEDVILPKVSSLLPTLSLLSSDEEEHLSPTPQEDNFHRFIRNTENNY